MPDEIAIEYLSNANDRRMSRYSNGMYDQDYEEPAQSDEWWPEAYDE